MCLVTGSFILRCFFLGEAKRQADGAVLPLLLAGANPLLRYSAVASATLIAILLHVAMFFWYSTRPAPLPFSAAAPLPMIAMVLSAPPAPNQAVAQPVMPPQPVKPKVTKKPQPKPAKKPKPKPKPKPVHRDAEVKQRVKPVEKAQEEPESAPEPAATPAVTHHAPAAAPHNERYTPSSSTANYLHNPIPDDPMTARQNHRQGRVLLRVFISASGQCEKLFVQRSSGHEELDYSALAAVKNWRFVPAKRGDTPEASWATVPIDFELD